MTELTASPMSREELTLYNAQIKLMRWATQREVAIGDARLDDKITSYLVKACNTAARNLDYSTRRR